MFNESALSFSDLAVVFIDDWQVGEFRSVRSVQRIHDPANVVHEASSPLELGGVHEKVKSDSSAIGSTTSHCVDCRLAQVGEPRVNLVACVSDGEVLVFVGR